MTRPASRPATPPGDVETALVRVRAAGGRVTTRVRALVEALFAHPRGMSVDEIVDMLAIDPATAYRSLVRLESAGVIEHLHFGHGAALYRVVGAPTVTVRCEACGTVVEVPASELAAATAHVRERYGIELHLGHVALSGRCSTGACATRRTT